MSDTANRFRHEAMATRFEIRIAAADAHYARQAADAAFAEIDRLERLWSRFQDNSDIGRLNRAAGKSAVRIAPETARLLEIAARMQAATAGAFDVTAGSHPEVHDPDARAGALRMDAPQLSARLNEEGWRVDAGGIAKGVALDLAGRLLEEDWELPRALLVAGGGSTVLAVDPPAGEEGWRVRAAPDDEVDFLRRRAVSASGGTVKGAHILDPRTGTPAHAGVRRAWAWAPGGAESDALSTALFVLGASEAQSVLSGNPQWSARFLREQEPLQEPLIG